MPPSPLSATSRYVPPGTRKIYWVTTIATYTAPTRGELNAGIALSNEIAAVAGFTVPSGTSPTLSSCGTAPDVSSAGFGLTDIAGRFKTGTTPGTACVVTFQTAYTNVPICFMQDETTAIVSRAVGATGSVTLNGVFVSADIINYWCIGRK